VHKDGVVLVDTGPSPDAMETRPVPTNNFWIAKLTEENLLERQLSLIGYKPEDISHIVLTHLHWDHVGQLTPFKNLNIPIVIQKKELEWALYSIWIGKGVYYTLEDMNMLREGFPLYPIDGRFELLDGVTAYWSGGHTPGHQILEVSLRSGNCYFLLGDFLHVKEELDKEMKGWLLSNVEEYLAMLKWLKLKINASRCKPIVAHDPNLWSDFPRAPKAIE
jgi:glyoxylase-like metal-dependent hydrolase (beta-lactamase superfamily II)